MGFSLMFTFQLHLTWVALIPFIITTFILELKFQSFKISLFLLFLGGFTLGAITLFPTLIKFPQIIFLNSGENLNFDIEKITRVAELFERYLNFATFDISVKFSFYDLASNKSQFAFIFLRIIKVVGVLQFVYICTVLLLNRKKKEINKYLILFGLTLVLALFLFLFSNKHLSSRTYILLYPIPLFLSFHAYNELFHYKVVRHVFYSLTLFLFITQALVLKTNFNEKYSFYPVENKINSALENKDPKLFGQRRKTKMDTYK